MQTENVFIRDIEVLYAHFFYRTPDQEGLNYWVNKLTSNEMVFATVARSIEQSAESVMKAQMQEIVGLYKGLLGRNVDAPGLEYWVSAVKSGQQIGDIARSMRQSSEGLMANSSDMDHPTLINELYAHLFNRTADVDGLHYWVDKLDQGESFSDVAVEMASFANVRGNFDGANLNATNLQNYLAIRSEYKALTVQSTNLLSIASIAPENVIQGTEGADSLIGTSGADHIYGKGGNDTIDGSDGADSIEGGTGDDTLHGGDVQDALISGGDGNDWLFGDANGSNAIYGNDGNDHIYPGPHLVDGNRNVIDGGLGNDFIEYDASTWNAPLNRDLIDGGGGDNWLVLTSVNDQISFHKDNFSNISTLFFSDWASYTSSFSVYLNQGTGVESIRGLDIGWGPATSEIKVMHNQTRFNNEPTQAYGNYSRDDYFNWNPVDAVTGPGQWYAYKGKYNSNGYITYFDEELGKSATVELTGFYGAGSINGSGDIVI